MAAALRPCPSGGHAVVGARRLCGISVSPSSSSPPRLIVPALGRQGRSISLVCHGLEGRTTATRLRHRKAAVVRAMKGSAADWPFGVEPDIMHMTDEQFKMFDEELKKNCELDKDMPFREEIETIAEYWKKIASWNTCIFEMEATSLSLHLCMIATKGVKLASRVMESTALRLDKQDENHLHTTKQTLMIYVSMFVKLAEDTYHKNFNDDSVFSLLGASRGVAAIGHILVKDALESVNYAEYGSSNYSLLVQNTDDNWHEFEQSINNLEDQFRAILENNSKKYDLMRSIMEKANTFTILFISEMVARHKRVLGYIPGIKGRRAAKASDEGEPDGLKIDTGSM